MKKNKSKLNPFHKYLIIALIIISLLLLGLIYFIGILPSNYFIFVTALLVIINGTLILKLITNKKKLFITFLSVITMVIMMICIIYEMNTIDFLKKLGYDVSTQNYSLVVLNTSQYAQVEDLLNKHIGLLESTEESYKDAVKHLEHQLVFYETKYANLEQLKESLIDNQVDAILVESYRLTLMKEVESQFSNTLKVLETFDIETVNHDIRKSANIEEDSFNIYISGIDTYGTINTLSRSDVNIVVSINPQTNHIHITSIPRDYYVELHSKKGYKDKLTHAGVYGIEESVATIEDLLDIDINYFIKVNFGSLINVVDAIGPIEVYSDYAFSSDTYDEFSEKYNFVKGKNILNGKEALAFCRERKSFIYGDRTRNENQEKVLEAIINRALSPVILTKYNTLLKALRKSIATNLTDEEITNFIKMQLDNNYEWTISNYILDGDDSENYTYTYSDAKLYVMEPNLDSLEEGKKLIKDTLNN